ncbi:IniB N-terminal domain-containing protein [Saccharothrix sp.]|uniref:IniB N-terminal domain-containing protein n=1 Tax=Saccharothrix sp. TaxID=1873460 RepID=UPI002810D723|nr:IniB N-terminal domain-containing protein [Saccharothrix sp.]
MGTSPNTLHDFVLDLLSNPTALAEFQADAEGSLAAAGLSDISALDVQEVLPLVLDYVPAGSLPALDGSLLNELPLDATDALGAIGQLQAVAQQVALSGVSGSSDVNLAAAGALSADASGLEVFGGVAGWGPVGDVAGSLDASLSGDFSAVGDVTGALDGTLATAGGVTDLATGSLDGALATAGGVTGALPAADGLTSPAFGAVDTLTGVVDSFGGFAGKVAGNVTTNVSGLDAGDVTTALNVDGLTGLASSGDVSPANVVDTVEDTADGLIGTAGLTSTVNHVGAVNAPLLGVGLNDVPVVGGGDISDALF